MAHVTKESPSRKGLAIRDGESPILAQKRTALDDRKARSIKRVRTGFGISALLSRSATVLIEHVGNYVGNSAASVMLKAAWSDVASSVVQEDCVCGPGRIGGGVTSGPSHLGSQNG